MAHFIDRDWLNHKMKYWLYLAVAIVAEVCATSALKASDGFSKPLPVLVVIVGYGLCFFLISLTLRVIPVGVVYAIWSGVGIVLIALAGWVLFDQRPDTPAVVGMLLIVFGVVVLGLYSKLN